MPAHTPPRFAQRRSPRCHGNPWLVACQVTPSSLFSIRPKPVIPKVRGEMSWCQVCAHRCANICERVCKQGTGRSCHPPPRRRRSRSQTRARPAHVTALARLPEPRLGVPLARGDDGGDTDCSPAGTSLMPAASPTSQGPKTQWTQGTRAQGLSSAPGFLVSKANLMSMARLVQRGGAGLLPRCGLPGRPMALGWTCGVRGLVSLPGCGELRLCQRLASPLHGKKVVGRPSPIGVSVYFCLKKT